MGDHRQKNALGRFLADGFERLPLQKESDGMEQGYEHLMGTNYNKGCGL